MRQHCHTFFQRLRFHGHAGATHSRAPHVVSPFALLALLLLGVVAQLGVAAQQPATHPPASQQAQPGVQTGAQPGAQSGVQSGAQSGVLASPLSPLAPAGSSTPYTVQSLVTAPTISPGALTLLELDGRLSQAVAAGGGSAFAQWFAVDAVTLNNGQPPVQGRGNIAAGATWKPADYQLTWMPQGASMGPSSDMGYTWGSYEGRSRDRNGEAVLTTGRYITVWRKQPDDQWKIALEASADDAPAAGACCALPKP